MASLEAGDRSVDMNMSTRKSPQREAMFTTLGCGDHQQIIGLK